jgi:hypothetical protein
VKGWKRFRVGVLLCRLETDCLAAGLEFEAGLLLEAAFLGQDGQYLQAAPERPAYAVIPLAAPSSTSLDQPRSAECLILLPLYPAFDIRARESLAPVMMLDGGVCVYSSNGKEAV